MKENKKKSRKLIKLKKQFIMKKFLILGAFLLVATVGIAKELQTISDGTECPMGCETASSSCCKTKGGSTYYGKL